MVIFLYGQDSYRSREKLNEIAEHYKKSGKSGVNLVYFDAERGEFPEFYDIFRVSSMFAEKKLVILKNLFFKESFRESFLENLKSLESLEDLIVVYEGEAVDERLSLFKKIVKECKSQEFKPLGGRELKAWYQAEFEKRGAKINQNALDILAGYVGNDLWRAANEVKKLADFRVNLAIKKEDVELQVKPRIENDIFKTIDALAAKNKKQALALVHKHLDAGEAPLYLLSMIAYQFRNLLLVKELAQKGMMYGSIAQKSGLHPFVVQKSYFACRQFSFEELKEIYWKIFKADIDIKTGKIEAETALCLLISSI